MHSAKQVTSFKLLILSLLVTCIAQTASAKSVYVITKHMGSIIKAYDIQDDQIQYQATAENLQSQGKGAVALALDPDSQILFITYEDSDIIEMLNAKSMISEQNPVTVPGATSLAGIAFDQEKQKVYVVQREYNILYVYLWNPVAKTLTLEGGTFKTLDYGMAMGIALNSTNKHLYVTNDTSTIHYYDTNDWSHKGEINLNKRAVAVAIDEARGYLYAGDYRFHKYLIKYKLNGDPNDPNTMIEKNIDPSSEGAYVIDLGVDKETGLVYATTFRYGSWGGFGGAIEVYDTSSWSPDANQIISPNDIETNDFSGPAGVAVGGLYKPPVFALVKDDNDVNCVLPLISEEEHELLGTPYNWLYYHIEYDANGFADTNVIITDHLPDEVNYITSDPCGVYDPNRHTVTWDINDISASDSNNLWITVGVNYYAKPGETIINLCEMESDRYYTFTTWPTDICCYGGDIIYVDADANGFNNGTSWLDAYTDLQDAFLGAANCDCNQIRVAQQTYRPTDINDTSARSISFELVNNVAVYGGFPPGGGTWTQRNPNVYETILSGDIAAPNNLYDNSYHVVKCVDVNNSVLDGFIITAGYADGSDANVYGGGVYCKDSNNIAVRNCIIKQNNASNGGGIHFKDSINLTFADCNVSGNSASNGGALYNDSSDPNITNCMFSDNSANKGGGVYNTSSSPYINNCIFNDNTASASGGGMYNYQSSPTLLNCIFTANTSTSDLSYGGGMVNSNQSSPTIISCTFSGNSAYWGGGISNSYYSEPNVINCVFTGNDATNYHGGGIYSENSALSFSNCIFTGNIAEYYGGGVYSSSSELNITNCLFIGNTAYSFGGGIANYDNNSLALTNCTFSGNWAHYGGGICNWYYSNANLTNCILWNNVAGTNGNEIYNDSGLSVTYCDVKGGWSGEGNINVDPCFFEVEQSGSWSANASYDESTFQSTLTDENADWAVNELAGKFVNPDVDLYDRLQFFIVSNDVNTIKVWSNVESIALTGKTYQIYDYHLTTDSPCIDSGDPNFNPDPNMTDIDGEPRVFDGDYNEVPIVDMGADEYYWSPADINSDGFVNFFDYAFFASAWQSKPSDPNYNEDCDLEDNNFIDYNDIALFCEDWLWQTAWAKAFPSAYDEGLGRSMSMGMGEGFFPSMQAKQAQPELTAEDIEEIIKWLEDLWLTDDQVRKMITVDEWLKFIESVKQAAKEQIYN